MKTNLFISPNQSDQLNQCTIIAFYGTLILLMKLMKTDLFISSKSVRSVESMNNYCILWYTDFTD